MKNKLKKTIILLLIFITSTSIIYLIFTIKDFLIWGNQLQLFLEDKDIKELNPDKITEISYEINNYEQALRASIDDEESEEHPLIAKHYDPLGYSVWVYLHKDLSKIPGENVSISIILGTTITIAYFLITNNKISNAFKIIIGYISMMIIAPQILFYLHYGRLFNILLAYYKTPRVEYFYIIYTAMFILMYIINYKIGKNMAKELNATIKKNNNKR